MKTYIFPALTSFLICAFSTLAFAETPPGPLPSPDSSLLDTKTAPCDDFYQHACGGWLATAQIPPDRPAWDRSFAFLREQNRNVLKGILEKYQAGQFEPANPYGKQLGDLYASCMDESQLEKGTMKSLREQLKKLEELRSEDVSGTIAWMHLHEMPVLFNLSASQDMKNPQQVIAEFHQGGMRLPARDYYLDQTPRMKEIRKKYSAHIAKMLQLAGETAKAAKSHADHILKLETQLARAALSPVEMRDVTKLYHPLSTETLSQLAPDLKWPTFWEGMGLTPPPAMNVTHPPFLKAVSGVLKSTPLADLKEYLKFQLVDRSAAALPERFYQQAFGFYGRTLSGQKEAPVRWKRCVDAVDDLMGFAIGRSFVDARFAGSSKDVAREMIERIERAQKGLLEKAVWMDSSTRKLAFEKLKKLANNVGYPDKWRGYEGLQITRESYFSNRLNAMAFNNRYDFNKIGKPLDRTEWGMTPATVNAYYDAQMAKMVFPSGILQPPFFHASYSDSANFGGIGMVMGHEISHGFDDEGRQFDGDGVMKDWWSESSASEYDKRATCLEKQYDGFPTVGGGHVNGKLTLGENIGDQGGIKLSYLAWKEGLTRKQRRDETALREMEKQFFLAFAQSWCSKESEAYEMLRISRDPHPPSRYRVNGALMNFPEFAEAFQCKAGAKMAPEKRCVIW